MIYAGVLLIVFLLGFVPMWLIAMPASALWALRRVHAQRARAR